MGAEPPHKVCLSALSNRTIDDFNGDSVTGALPVYEGSWNVVVNGNCSTCYVQLDTSQPFDRTWHDSTQRATEDPYSVTLQFTGTAIYFYGIVPNTAQHGTTKANTKIDVTFTLDGAAVGEYKHTPDTSSTILYSVPMLSSTGLSNKAHTLVVTYTDLLIFDYAMYTFDDGVSSPPDPPPASVPTPDSSTSTPTSTTPSGPGSSSQAHSSSAASSESSGSLTSNIGLKTGVSGPSVITSFVPVSATGGPQPDSNSNQTITGNSAAAGTSTSHFPVAIVVAVACAVVALALVAFALLWCRRRKQTAPRKSFLVDPDPKTHGSAHASLVYSAQTSQMGHSTQSLVSNAYSTQSLVSNARPLESSVPSSHGTTWEGSSYGPSESSVSSSQWTEEVAQPRPHASGSRPEMRPPSYSPQDPSRPALDSTPSLGGKYQLSVEGGRIVEEP